MILVQVIVALTGRVFCAVCWRMPLVRMGLVTRLLPKACTSAALLADFTYLFLHPCPLVDVVHLSMLQLQSRASPYQALQYRLAAPITALFVQNRCFPISCKVCNCKHSRQASRHSTDHLLMRKTLSNVKSCCMLVTAFLTRSHRHKFVKLLVESDRQLSHWVAIVWL